jgi:hypothetical protein
MLIFIWNFEMKRAFAPEPAIETAAKKTKKALEITVQTQAVAPVKKPKRARQYQRRTEKVMIVFGDDDVTAVLNWVKNVYINPVSGLGPDSSEYYSISDNLVPFFSDPLVNSDVVVITQSGRRFLLDDMRKGDAKILTSADQHVKTWTLNGLSIRVNRGWVTGIALVTTDDTFWTGPVDSFLNKIYFNLVKTQQLGKLLRVKWVGDEQASHAVRAKLSSFTTLAQLSKFSKKFIPGELESTGDESTDDESTGDESTGDESTDDESTDDEPDSKDSKAEDEIIVID